MNSYFEELRETTFKEILERKGSSGITLSEYLARHKRVLAYLEGKYGEDWQEVKVSKAGRFEG